MKRKVKEFKLTENENINITLGTVSKDNPVAIYLLCRFWIKPKYDDNILNKDNIQFYLNELKINFKKFLYKNKLSNKFIFDYDFNFNSMSIDNYNFLTIDIVLKQLNEVLKITDFKNKYLTDFNSIFKVFIDDLTNSDFIIIKKR